MNSRVWSVALVVLASCSVETFTFEGDPASASASVSDASTTPLPVPMGAGPVAAQPVACVSGVCPHTVSIITEENGDGVVSPGETVTLEVQMVNGGATAIPGVYAQLLSIPAEARVTNCYGAALCPGECGCTAAQAVGALASKAMARALRFQLKTDRATFKSSPLEFGIVIYDAMGNFWPGRFAVNLAESAASLSFSTYRVVQDNNDDAKPSPGDQVTLAIHARNDGRTGAAGVYANLTKVPDGVVLTACTGVAGNCPANCTCGALASSVMIGAGTESANPVLQFTAQLSAILKLDTPLAFGMTLSDKTGRAWAGDFSIPLVASGAKIAVASQDVVNDTNRNQRLERGETATLRVFANNTGTSTVRGLVARLTSVSPDLTITSCSGTRGVCAGACQCETGAGGLALRVGATSPAPVLSVVVQLSQMAGSPLPLKVEFEDDAHNKWSQDLNIDIL